MAFGRYGLYAGPTTCLGLLSPGLTLKLKNMPGVEHACCWVLLHFRRDSDLGGNRQLAYRCTRSASLSVIVRSSSVDRACCAGTRSHLQVWVWIVILRRYLDGVRCRGRRRLVAQQRRAPCSVRNHAVSYHGDSFIQFHSHYTVFVNRTEC
jgi:hypothetical protein